MSKKRKMSKTRRCEIAGEVRAELVERFPMAFLPIGHWKLPLMIGIDKVIRERWPEISRRRLSVALHDYTSGPKYLRMLVEGAKRIDLDGEVVDDAVSTEAAVVAAKRVRRYDIIAQRRTEAEVITKASSEPETEEAV